MEMVGDPAGSEDAPTPTDPLTATMPTPARRRSSATSTPTPRTNDTHAPSVWTTPDWAAHPVIENYYGHARRARDNSFVEVMRSPTCTAPTRTLAETCNSYNGHDETEDDDDDDHEDEDHDVDEDEGPAVDSRRPLRRSLLLPHSGKARTRPPQRLGSFSTSYTTETCDEATASPFSAGESGFHLRPPPSASLGLDDGSEPVMTPISGGQGYAQWNRLRQQQHATVAMVPIPDATNLMKRKPSAKDLLPATFHHEENPQGGSGLHLDRRRSSGSSSSSSIVDDSSGSRPRPAPTTARLRHKLQECLAEIDERIDAELELTREAMAVLRKRRPSLSNTVGRESLMWSLLCGQRSSSSASGAATSADGIELLRERLTLALHTRALNQLHRHRRHVRGILQIVTSHNPDLFLTEKQLDSFESASAMLANDLKYSLLQKQVDALATTSKKRREAYRHAQIKNGRDCFASTRVKSAMLGKLLEAVSWYRLVQTNAREESASSSVGVGIEASRSDDVEHVPQPLCAPSSTSSSSSSLCATRSLQELQVEKILSVLAGEEFYSDYNELMCQADWWEIAQAHFENLIFAKFDSRICQWLRRVSEDVASVSNESLDEEAGLRLDEKRHVRNGDLKQQQLQRQPAEWTRDPQPEQILDFLDRLTKRIRKDLDVPNDVTKSLHSFIQRAMFPRLALLCFNQKSMIDSQRKDKLWRKRCIELSGISLENLSVAGDLAEKIRSNLPNRRVPGGRAYLIRSIDAFNCMTSVVPCDLLDELMYGVIILHHEAALVLGTTQFSVETFFPLLAYVLVHCNLPTIHAQLHLLENFAITSSNANGEESYYVYCVHAAVEYICNSAGLHTNKTMIVSPEQTLATNAIY